MVSTRRSSVKLASAPSKGLAPPPARRSSQKLKKAKLENDVVVTTAAIDSNDDNDSDDDFQKPIQVMRRRTLRKLPEPPTRSSPRIKKEGSSSSATTSPLSLFDKASPAASSSTTTKDEDDKKASDVKVEDYSDMEDMVVDSESTSRLNSAAHSPELALTEIDSDATNDEEEEDELTEENDELDFAPPTPEATTRAVDEESSSSSSSSNEDGSESEAESTDGSGDNPPSPVRGRRGDHYKITQEKVLKQHPEMENVWTDLETTEAAEVTPVEQPAELGLDLLPFQKHGVGWMIQQESLETFQGGILADEMGMGKTIQTIALLLSDKKKPNLVIAPTVALGQWKREIETHTNKALSVYIYHGATKTKEVQELKSYHVVLTTYSTLENAFRRQESGAKKLRGGVTYLRKEKSLLHKVHWHRVILDEAHNIKDRANNTARAVFNMKGNFKWSLTGTPLQNRVGELYSLIRFMQADPFAYYFCKACPCKSLTWSFSDKRTCDDCGHTPMSHVCWWNNEVLKPIQKHGYIGDGREALRKLRLLLDRIMLRRTKVECADDLGLPPRTVIVRRDIFNEEEEDLYTSLYSSVARTFTTYVEEGTVLNNYANIFELLTKMRQCADHPDLVTKKTTDNKQLVCMLCNDPPEDAVAATCKHVFCRECCIQYYNSFDDHESAKPLCPSCYATFTVDLSQPAMELDFGGAGTNANYSKSSIVNRIDMAKWRSSTKIEALVEELSNLRREDKTIKSIVFSQFVNFLDLIYWRLSRAGFECIRLDGTMTPTQRDAAIKHFMTKPTVTVFLISLKAGGVALNLTEASRVFICDPWWNPAAELQAMDRIHRLGQHRPIRITRLIIENSIESRIVQLQEKKTALVASTVGNDTSALDKLTVDDLRFLFVM